jgi:hypothetical protein
MRQRDRYAGLVAVQAGSNQETSIDSRLLSDSASAPAVEVFRAIRYAVRLAR